MPVTAVGGRSNDGLQGLQKGSVRAMMELNPATDAHDDRLDALRRSPRLQYPREAELGRSMWLVEGSSRAVPFANKTTEYLSDHS